jgi:hypothetical protein
MSTPFLISIPHRLGKDEAIRRLKSGLGNARIGFAHLLVHEEVWTGSRLQFRVGVIGQFASGTIDVFDDRVRLDVQLPWLLARFAEAFAPAIRSQGVLLLGSDKGGDG